MVNEKEQEAGATLAAFVIMSVLAGAGAWSFGLPLRLSLGVAIIAFFISLVLGD